tara:strand:+ start:1082 stop:1792 length:711 start_codon:yes stop_codon:yes gene_type:complete
MIYNILLIFLSILFIGHGFCDFIPLLQTLNLRFLGLYILIIAINIYLHLITPSISTLIFALVSSIHFSGDFYPRNEVKLPGIGFYVLGLPAMSKTLEFKNFLIELNITYPDLFLNILIIGGLTSLLEPFLKQDHNIFPVFIFSYTLLIYVFGLMGIFYYMVFYHLPVSLYELIEKYNPNIVINTWIIGSIISGLLIGLLINLKYIEEIYDNKNIVIGGVFGLLNAHSMTTLIWRNI